MDGPSWKLCYCNDGAWHRENSIIGHQVKDLRKASWRMEVVLKHLIVWKGEKAAQSMEHAARLRSLPGLFINLTAYFILNAGGPSHILKDVFKSGRLVSSGEEEWTLHTAKTRFLCINVWIKGCRIECFSVRKAKQLLLQCTQRRGPEPTDGIIKWIIYRLQKLCVKWHFKLRLLSATIWILVAANDDTDAP